MYLQLIQSVKLLFSLLLEILLTYTGTNVWTHKRGPGLWTLERLDSEECRIPEFRTHAVKSSCVRGKEERGLCTNGADGQCNILLTLVHE